MKKLNVKNNFTKSNQNGITLIALIVTIIVLIIIAGISIATLTADNGILRQVNTAKVTQIESTAREQVKLATSAMRLAIAEARAQDNSYSAIANAEVIQGKLLDIIKADNTSLDKQGWDKNTNAENNKADFKISYSGEDYKNACNYDDAEIVYTITLGQSSIEITDEVNATLKDQNQNDVEIDIGGNDNTGSGNGSGNGGNQGGGSGSGSQTIAAGLYETGSNYTVMLTSWDDLVADGTVHVENGVVYTNMSFETWENTSSDALAGDLMLPNDGSITVLGDAGYDEFGNYTGNAAFGNCTNLTSITIPDGVTTIGVAAFGGCANLTSIEIPNSVTSIGIEAFTWCQSLTSVTFGENSQLVTIDAGAFRTCTSLTSITIPDGVTSIGSCAFDECYNLTTVNYMGTLEQWFKINFADASANPRCYGGADLYINNQLITEIVMSNTMTSIGNYAFVGFARITSITIPDSVTTIGDNAFAGCTNLASVTFGENSQLTTLGNQTFNGCTSLTSITIPDGVTSIGEFEFYECTNLTSVTFGENSQLTTIAQSAFEDCTSLTSVTFGENSQLTTIAQSAFEDCTSLTSIVIPESVTIIDMFAFYKCTSLTSITFEGTMAQWNAITKGTNWNWNVPATTVQCSDATVSLS